MNIISESDWKKFKKIKEAALERFCQNILNDVVKDLNSSSNRTNHAKYLDLYRLIESRDKKIVRLFDGHSRSKARLQLMLLREEGLVGEEDVQDMSEEFKEHTKPRPCK